MRESAKQDYRLSAIVLGIVGSDAFQMAEVPKPESRSHDGQHTAQNIGKGTRRC